MVSNPVCKTHYWFVPNSGEDGIALAKCLACGTPQYQPLDGLRETLAMANKLNRKNKYPLILTPEKVQHREPLYAPEIAHKVAIQEVAPVPVQVVSSTPVHVKRKLRKNHQWTEEEQGLVRLHYDGTRESVKMLMGLLGCTRYAVKGQIQILGLGHHKEPNWTEKELRYLKTHYQKQSVRVMAHTLHRSMNAVKIKATRLHFSLRARDGWYSKMEVCEILGVGHRTVQRWIDSGGIKATYHTGRKPSQKGMAMWHIDAADLKAFIIGHCRELQGRNINLFCILHLCGVVQSDAK